MIYVQTTSRARLDCVDVRQEERQQASGGVQVDINIWVRAGISNAIALPPRDAEWLRDALTAALDALSTTPPDARGEVFQVRRSGPRCTCGCSPAIHCFPHDPAERHGPCQGCASCKGYEEASP